MIYLFKNQCLFILIFKKLIILTETLKTDFVIELHNYINIIILSKLLHSARIGKN